MPIDAVFKALGEQNVTVARTQALELVILMRRRRNQRTLTPTGHRGRRMKSPWTTALLPGVIKANRK